MKPQPSTSLSKERLKNIPRLSGVYLMKDAKGTVIYIGKARNLRARVRSYFVGNDGRHRVQFLLRRVHNIETLVTEDERQAIILESDLIKKYKPHYNVRLKDDKAYLIVRIDTNQQWPRLELVRKIADDGARYIGPFAFSYELRVLLEVINRGVPLRTCSDKIFHNRVRPCLEYQIHRCAGPCCLNVDQGQYSQWVKQAISILEGKNDEVTTDLTRELERASEERRFEDAAFLRDRLQLLQKINFSQPGTNFSGADCDAFGIYRERDAVEFSVLMVRRGRLFEAKTFGFSGVEIPDQELCSSLLSQFYAGDQCLPDEILVPLGLEDKRTREELYSERRKKRVHIRSPKRGPKARILALALANARENFAARFGEKSGNESILDALQTELGLEETPRTVECVDVSHFQGGATVGSVVFFKDGRPERSRYRTFHLSQEGKPDDFASMREIVLRHLSRCQEENTVVDLMVIDGGPAQLQQAISKRKELGMKQPMLIALAKKRAMKSHYRVHEGPLRYKPERVYIEDKAVAMVLAPGSKALHFLERIRDEAHRFAVAFHRRTRSKRTFRSELESIQGIGAKRRVELLKEFGSIQAIREASPADLMRRCRIPEKLAVRIAEKLKAKSFIRG